MPAIWCREVVISLMGLCRDPGWCKAPFTGVPPRFQGDVREVLRK
jgi:hypothetical protein